MAGLQHRFISQVFTVYCQAWTFGSKHDYFNTMKSFTGTSPGSGENRLTSYDKAEILHMFGYNLYIKNFIIGVLGY